MNDSVSASAGYDLASPGKRLLGYVIDMAVVFVLLYLKGLLDYVAVYFSSAGSAVVFHYLHFLLFWLVVGYMLFCDALPNGQSLGKRLCRTSVVGYPYPTNCSVFQSFLRNVPKLLFSLLDGLFVLFGMRRRLGDMLAKTIVINSPPARRTETA